MELEDRLWRNRTEKVLMLLNCAVKKIAENTMDSDTSWMCHGELSPCWLSLASKAVFMKRIAGIISLEQRRGWDHPCDLGQLLLMSRLQKQLQLVYAWSGWESRLHHTRIPASVDIKPDWIYILITFWDFYFILFVAYWINQDSWTGKVLFIHWVSFCLLKRQWCKGFKNTWFF